MNIETPEDWWNLVDYKWEKLKVLLVRDVDKHGYMQVHKPTADGGWGEQILIGDPEHKPTYPGQYGEICAKLLAKAEKAKTEKDHETMLELLNQAFHAAPDHPNIHRRPGWSTLCDLCSESWVFQNA